MQIARRLGAWANSGQIVPTAKDYIQDGGIAIWDGIENDGWGKHSSSITPWKSLIGNYLLNIQTDASGFWEDSSFNYSGSQNCYGNYPSSIVDLIKSGNFSFELIYKLNTKKRSSILSNGYQCFSFCIEDEVDKYSVYVSSKNLSRSSASSINSHSLNCIDNTAYYRINNGSPAIIAFDAPTSYPRWGIGVTASGNYAKAVCNIYGIRIYNRSLTDAEIAHNYAIDKVRFNLP